jgi:hypothetical protein
VNVKEEAIKMADRLREYPRGEEDLDTAALLLKLADVYVVARELAYAKSHEHRNATYQALVDLIKGKPVD